MPVFTTATAGLNSSQQKRLLKSVYAQPVLEPAGLHNSHYHGAWRLLDENGNIKLEINGIRTGADKKIIRHDDLIGSKKHNLETMLTPKILPNDEILVGEAIRLNADRLCAIYEDIAQYHKASTETPLPYGAPFESVKEAMQQFIDPADQFTKGIFAAIVTLPQPLSASIIGGLMKARLHGKYYNSNCVFADIGKLMGIEVEGLIIGGLRVSDQTVPMVSQSVQPWMHQVDNPQRCLRVPESARPAPKRMYDTLDAA